MCCLCPDVKEIRPTGLKVFAHAVLSEMTKIIATNRFKRVCKIAKSDY